MYTHTHRPTHTDLTESQRQKGQHLSERSSKKPDKTASLFLMQLQGSVVWSCHFIPLSPSSVSATIQAELPDPACSSLSSDNVRGISDNGPDQAARAGQFKGSITVCPSSFATLPRGYKQISEHVCIIQSTKYRQLCKLMVISSLNTNRNHKSTSSDFTGHKPHSASFFT